MKYLALSLMLYLLPPLSDAWCFQNAIEPGMTHCQDHVDKTWHAVGSSWRNSDCMDCDCSGCCTGYVKPVSFPDDCVSVFDSVNCKYIVHKWDDPSVICDVFAALGK